MTPSFSPALNSWLLRAAGAIVPRSLRRDFDEQFGGPLWEFMLFAASAGTPDSRLALADHLHRAWRFALRARFSRDFFGSPWFCLGTGAALVVGLAILSGGLPAIRRLTHPLPYRDADKIVVLAQGPPFFGTRMGFRDRETEVFRAHPETLASVAAYTWTSSVIALARGHREVTVAEIGPQFFDVLGVAPALGQGLERTADADGDETFLASDDFWRRELRATAAAVGQKFEIGGRSLRLAGVLPRDFTFLSVPIAIWVAAPPEPPIPPRRWWMGLRGAVARLAPGVSQAVAEKDLRRALVRARLARANFQIQTTPIADLVYRPVWSYGSDFLIAMGLMLLWSGFHTVRDHHLGARWRVAMRFWAFFALKTLLPLLALLVLVFEFSGAMRLGVTGGARSGQGPLSVWFFYAVLVVILIWAIRDQPRRCRTCLYRLHHPIRIGVAGPVLLETSGEEVMCPYGHGSVFTSESVLGSEISDRWREFP